jgi:hypothetical protein
MFRSRALPFFVSIGIACTIVSLHAQATTNLSSQGYYADPEVRVFDHQYWIYSTRSVSADDPAIGQPIFNAQQTEQRKQHVIHKDYLLQTGLDAFSSPDLFHWTKHNSVLSVKNVAWAAYAIWAPSAILSRFVFRDRLSIRQNQSWPIQSHYGRVAVTSRERRPCEHSTRQTYSGFSDWALSL